MLYVAFKVITYLIAIFVIDQFHITHLYEFVIHLHEIIYMNLYHLRMRRGNMFGSVCVSVCLCVSLSVLLEL